MNRKVYCACDSDFSSHFKRQSGRGFSDIEVFRGAPYQRGYGIGSLLKRFGIPILSTIGKSLLKTGLDIGSDVLKDGNIKEAVKIHGKRGIKRAAAEGLEEMGRMINQSGKGIRRVKRARKKTPIKRKKRVTKKAKSKRRKIKDIFS